MKWRAMRLVVWGSLCVGGVALAQEDPIDDFFDPGWQSPLRQLNQKMEQIYTEFTEIDDCYDLIPDQVEGLVDDVVSGTSATNAGVLGVQADVELAYDGLKDEVRPRLGEVDAAIDAALLECVFAEFTCSDGILYGTVNGREVVESCFEYACDGASCRTWCGGDGDCGRGFYCSDGKCLVEQGGICANPVVIGTRTFYTSAIDGRGVEEDCGAYTCEGGKCRTSCAVTDDCAAGRVCDTLHSVCVEVGQ